MNSHYDLHTHSRHSDGTLSPTELVQRAHARGVTVLALTDHDVTDGLTEATVQAGTLGMTLIAGVEVSVSWQNQTVHIVGLDIDAALPALQHGLGGLREFRHWRAQEIDRRLARKRILGALEGASRHAHGAILSRTHFARFLVEQGHARDLRQAFKHFLTRDKPGYVPGRWAPLADAVRWIRDAGGVAVIAHPARYRLSAGKLRRLIGEFRECGGGAIEVVSGGHDVETCRHFGNIAREHGLLASVGSDYHGPGQSWCDVGGVPPLPVGCAPVWQAWDRDRPAVAAAC
jgi:predicted metal-dependent phosphoesterase TrpH